MRLSLSWRQKVVVVQAAVAADIQKVAVQDLSSENRRIKNGKIQHCGKNRRASGGRIDR
jgi:hypothetical protein